MQPSDLVRLAREAGWVIHDNLRHSDQEAIQDALLVRLAYFADAVLAEAQRAATHQWVPCETRMPPHQTPVIAWRERAIGPCEMNYDAAFGWFWADGEACIGQPPTHWLPMPHPPADKEAQG